MILKLLSDIQIRDRDIDTLKRFIRHRLGGYMVAINDVPAGHLVYRGVRCPERPVTRKSIEPRLPRLPPTVHVST
jgi:hypothetical protein